MHQGLGLTVLRRLLKVVGLLRHFAAALAPVDVVAGARPLGERIGPREVGPLAVALEAHPVVEVELGDEGSLQAGAGWVPGGQRAAEVRPSPPAAASTSTRQPPWPCIWLHQRPPLAHQVDVELLGGVLVVVAVPRHQVPALLAALAGRVVEALGVRVQGDLGVGAGVDVVKDARLCGAGCEQSSTSGGLLYGWGCRGWDSAGPSGTARGAAHP